VAVLFTFHHQADAQSVALHTIYAAIMAAFSVLRIMTLYIPTLGLACVFFGAWSALLLGIASEDGVAWEKHVHLDAPATAFFSGMASAVLTGAMVCAFGGGGGGGEGGGGGGGGGESSDGGGYERVLMGGDYGEGEEEEEDFSGGGDESGGLGGSGGGEGGDILDILKQYDDDGNSTDDLTDACAGERGEIEMGAFKI